ncbi:T-complex protein 1 subunit beta [Mortierella alpina]|nr:T-complex protein 1 subunit beta [Mortierella alpina]
MSKRKKDDDNDRVLIGTRIGEDHVNYVLMYNMLTGIRVSVSRCNAKPQRALVDEDFGAAHKLAFDITGNELTPSSKYDFKFKDYAPWVFRHLRQDFHIDASDYLVSLTSKYILSELGSPGKSGSFFYFSQDYRFIIKTIHHAEHKFMRKILKDYFNHVKQNPHTLLCRFFGLHRVKLPHGRKIHFVVMGNVFPPNRDIHETYDLKGSTLGRAISDEELNGNPRATQKDLNWVNRNKKLELGPVKRHLFVEQTKRDVQLLARLNIMDYSLLVGIHDIERGNKDNIRDNTLKVFHPDTSTPLAREASRRDKRGSKVTALRMAVKVSDPVALGPSTLPSDSFSERRNCVFYADDGGLLSTNEQNDSGQDLYYLGVIDILTPYNYVKKVEHLWKSLSQDKSLAPVQIFQDNATEERAENARLSSFIGAIAVGDLVKSTLGPKGMDKILQSASTGEVMVTNDGATILKSIALDNAAAKVLVNISKVQDDEVGDGTTSVCVLAAELLREAEKLVSQKIHPQTIIEGFRIASAAAYKALEESAIDHSGDAEVFRADLINIAKTTLSSKVLSQDKEYFSKLAVDAVLRLKGSTNLENIQIIKKVGGRLADSYLDEGFILDKKIGVNQPKRIENAKIMVANTPMDTDKIKIFGARIRVEGTSKLEELERAEREKMRAKVEKIKDHGITCFVNRQLIYNWPEQLFADAGIMSIEHADFDGVERLALVTGGEITSTFDHPELVRLGECDVIEEVIIGEDRLIKFSGVKAGEACTIVLRGATHQLLDESERSLHDALSVLSQTTQEPRTVLGGGCSEVLMSKAVDEVAAKTAGKQQAAIEAFSRALRQMPTILADNGGYDSADLVAKLRASHYDGNSTHGLDMEHGRVGDMHELGITESFKLKRQVLLSASEAAEMILRVDDIIRCAPRQRQG